jgi:methyl-accepting chemotaxis protein
VLIEDSTGRVADGASLAGKTGQTMQGIVTSIDRVSSIMNDIVASSREQAIGIAQVNQAITQMDGSTQQNAAMVEESAAASRAMQEQSGKLLALVALFQVEAPAAPMATGVRRALPAAAVKAAPGKAAAAAPVKPQATRAARPASKAAPLKPAKPAKPAGPAAVADDWEEF